jgi:hypothetical protein
MADGWLGKPHLMGDRSGFSVAHGCQKDKQYCRVDQPKINLINISHRMNSLYYNSGLI